MDRSTDSEVLHAASDWLEAADAVTLVTVARTWGSAPRRPGALMAIHPDGRFVGSVSGGCVEDDLAQQVLSGRFEEGLPRLLEYGVSAADARSVGLPCGGRLTLLAERVEAPAQIRLILESLGRRRPIARRVCINTGEVSLHPPGPGEDLQFDGDNLVKVFGPAWRLLIIGAGELPRRVAQLALTLDYAVTICDSRPEYAHDWQVEGTELVTSAPARTVADFRPDSRTAILALSHTPALDDEALAAALQSEAFYVGALGSKRHHDTRCKRLRKKGVANAQLARLHGPAGLDIGSRTPAEIAIAMAAGLIVERRAAGHRDRLPAPASLVSDQ